MASLVAMITVKGLYEHRGNEKAPGRQRRCDGCFATRHHTLVNPTILNAGVRKKRRGELPRTTVAKSRYAATREGDPSRLGGP